MKYNTLAAKAGQLLASPHFDTINDGSARYVEKQGILLALCGKKPVSEAVTSRYVQIPGGRQSTPDDETQVAALLDDLGLAYFLRSDEYVTVAVVSLDPTLVGQYKQAIGREDGARRVGQLFGYPATAIAAFEADDLLSMDEQDDLMNAAGLPLLMPQFCMSRTHAAEELSVLQEWHKTIAAFGFYGEEPLSH
jgi:hypothetical protein